MYVILVYDINFDNLTEGSKVLRNVFKISKKYLHHIQNSVFEGEIDKVNLLKLKASLKKFLRIGDSCVVFMSRNSEWLDKEFLVDETDKTSNFI